MGRNAFRKDTHTGFKAAKGKRVMYKKHHDARGLFEPRPLVAAAYALSYPEAPRLGPKDFAGDTARQYLLRHHGFTLEREGAPASDRESTEPPTKQTVVIDGVSYPHSQLQQRLAIHQTARTTYARALSEELPKQAAH